MADAFIKTRYVTSDKRTSRYHLDKMRQDLINTAISSADKADAEKDQRDIMKDFE